ncbi:hypothetical protein FRC02_012080 [Tulasnella sp. 418]|nr:hypothetical protein FRC02_012080 [Tulasnella sp. 418]
MVMPQFFEKYAKEIGPLYQVLLGPSTLVILSDIHEIEDLLVRKSKTLDVSPVSRAVFGGLTPHGQVALPTTSDQWKKHRRLGGPGMSARYLKYISPRISNGAQILVSYWKEKMALVRQRGGTCFNVSTDLPMCTMDAIAEIAFGEEYSGINDIQPILHSLRCVIDEYGGATFPDVKGTPLQQASQRHLKRLTRALALPPFLMKSFWLFTKRTAAFKRDDELFRGVIASRISQARKRAANAHETGGSEIADCILDLMVEKDVKEGGEQYTDAELIDEMVNYMLAGFDSTASALMFGIKFLMNHPNVQFKLREELLSSLQSPQDRLVTYDEIANGDKTPYLEAVVNEILRCAQVGAAINREVQEDIVVMGKHIPKGTQMLMMPGLGGLRATKSWAKSRANDPGFNPTKEFWDDMNYEEFNPDRWLVTGEDGKIVFSQKQGYSAPFSFGPKACFGQKLAVLEIKVILATLNLAFFWDKVPDELNGPGLVEVLTRKPEMCYVNLVDWEEYSAN